ncbi:hypothetical protein PQR64_03380 [Paraburkholderia phytofirmans]|uniref:hypothetical protein n=1 Tax=Paraburkholderia phytofirmans TaxID=261302 RepID=UPI0038BE1142
MDAVLALDEGESVMAVCGLCGRYVHEIAAGRMRKLRRFVRARPSAKANSKPIKLTRLVEFYREVRADRNGPPAMRMKARSRAMRSANRSRLSGQNDRLGWRGPIRDGHKLQSGSGRVGSELEEAYETLTHQLSGSARGRGADPFGMC